MAALRIPRFIAQLFDVDASSPSDGDVLTYDAGSGKWVNDAAGGGGGAPTTVDYLVGTASGSLSAEIAVGTTPGGELGGTWASPTIDGTHSGSSHAAVQAAAEATAAAALSSAISGLSSTYQPLDSDLTAIAALTTTSFGRALLALADQAALLSAAGAAASTHVHAGEDITSGTVADARIASTIARDSEVTSAVAALSSVYQPLDSDLTAIAALTTTSYGRAFLALADAAAGRTALGLVIGTDVEAHDADLTTIAGLTPTNDDVLQRKAGAWANRTLAQLMTDLAALGTTFQPLDSDLTAFAGLAIATDKLPYGTGSHTLGLTDLSAFARTFLDDADAATVRATLGVTTGQDVVYSARSSNTILAAGDKGKVIAATAAYTQTFTAAATLGSGWWCVVKNNTQDGTTVLVLDPNASETIDGLTTATMYSGETRLIECDGSNFTSQLLEGGYAKFTPTGGNFIIPAGVTAVDVVCIGSGGQGGGGFAGGAGSGGGGGGGGAVSRAVCRPADLGAAGATVTVAVPAGGSAAGAGGIQGGAAAQNGSDGSATTFGTAVKAGGGGGGTAGASAASNLGGGGGGSAVNTASGSTAGSPSSSTASGGAAATSTLGSGAGRMAEWGGASGAGSGNSNATGNAGGSSIYGGAGGGGGGSGASTGGAGGANQSYTAGGGPSGGSGGAAPNPGGSGAATTPTPFCGQGGGGGGGSASASTTAGKGGAAGIGAGGGGGGSSISATSSIGGAGGNGGAGECRVTYS